MANENTEQPQPLQTPEHTVQFDFIEETPGQQQPPTDTDSSTEQPAVTDNNAGAADLEPAEKKPAKRSRETKTVSFYTTVQPGNTQSEFEYLDEILQARIDSGITQDWNHFIRQCVDYAVNNQFTPKHTGGIIFARPQLPPVLLKDAFFNNKK
jgi:hypothetical protein